MKEEPTPRVNKAMVHAGAGFDQYGTQRDGKWYCPVEVAKELERELRIASRKLARLEKARTALLKTEAAE